MIEQVLIRQVLVLTVNMPIQTALARFEAEVLILGGIWISSIQTKFESNVINNINHSFKALCGR